ncbi:MAG: ester cyclase [Rubrobacteraceae bacterium]
MDSGVLLKAWVDKAHSFLSSPRAIRWGGFALVAGGLLGVASGIVRSVLTVEYSNVTSPDFGILKQLSILSGVSMLVGMLFVALGLVSLYALVAARSERVRRLAGAGLLIATLPSIAFVGLFLYSYLGPQSGYYDSGPGSFFNALFFAWAWIRPFGILLLGVAALWGRGLGRWRFLPAVIGLMACVSSAFIYFVYQTGAWFPGGGAILSALLSSVPFLVPDLGWTLLGTLLPGAKRRELAILAKEKRMLETRNLSLARRLCEQAWGRGNLQVVDELVSPDFFDHHHNRSGPQGFRRSIAGLRETFPDLAFTLEEQSAEGDTVTTRCTMGGTDEGGVLWYPPTGKRATFESTFADRFSEGRLVEHRGESDLSGLLKQLGLPHLEEQTVQEPVEPIRSRGRSGQGA